MATIHIRSSALVQTVAFVRETFGEANAQAIANTLPRGIRRKIQLAVLDAWVEFEVFHGLLQRLADDHYQGDITRVAESGRFAAGQEYPRRFGALSLPADGTLVDRLNAFATLWRMIVDHGQFRATVTDGIVELEVSDFPAATPLYGHRLRGWLEGYIHQLTGDLAPLELHQCDPDAPASLVFRIVSAPGHRTPG